MEFFPTGEGHPEHVGRLQTKLPLSSFRPGLAVTKWALIADSWCLCG